MPDSASSAGYILVIRGPDCLHVPPQDIEPDPAAAQQALAKANRRAALGGRATVYELVTVSAPGADGPQSLEA